MYFSCRPHFLVDIAFTSAGMEACILHERDDLIEQWVNNARELLQDECSTPLQLGEVARRLNIHPVTLSKGFRAALRCPPRQYITRCGLKAVDLMRTTGKSLASIAAEAGFFDQSHFCRVFGDA